MPTIISSVALVMSCLLGGCADEVVHRSAHMVCFGFCQRVEVEGSSSKHVERDGAKETSEETNAPIEPKQDAQ